MADLGTIELSLIGGTIAAITLALFLRIKAQALGQYAYVLLAMILAIYIGARLATGSFEHFVIEAVCASIVLVLTRILMSKWLPAVGLVILLHGIYDAMYGVGAGAPPWYPAFCAGFDLIAGGGLIAVLMRKTKQEVQT